MELRSTGVSELSLIASVNEAIKCAIAASERIGLIAVNANLPAWRAGSNVAGFCVVANELRNLRANERADVSSLRSSGNPVPAGDSLFLCNILIYLMNLRASALRIASLPRFVLCADEKRL